MVRFYWIDDLYAQPSRKSDDDVSYLRQIIMEHGVDTADRHGRRIFDVIFERHFTKEMIDVIFEFKPTFPSILKYHGMISNSKCIYVHNCYVLSKFLKQDVDYRYIRCTFRFYGTIYSDFIDFYYNNTGLFDDKFEFMFRNHFMKGISMFELMKYRYFDKNNNCFY